MAIKGSILKQEVAKKILEVFSNSFQYDKEIRICGTENGEEVQIKVTLTAAKTNVSPNGENALPGEVNENISFEAQVEKEPVTVSQDEKKNVAELLQALGL